MKPTHAPLKSKVQALNIIYTDDSLTIYSDLFFSFPLLQEELKGDHATYMRHHPELKALLADFLQFLLLRKPEDVVAFAADYFASFSPTTKIGSSYATSNEPRYTPRPNSPFKKRNGEETTPS